MQVVYADVLWLIDFSMDLLSLALAARMVQRPIRGKRLCAAAALGGVWSVLALVGDVSGMGGLLLDLAVAGGMVILAFGRSSLLRFGLTLGSFCLVSLLLGGSMTALSNLFVGLRGQTASGSGGNFFLLALAGSGITFCCTHLRRRAAPRRVEIHLRCGARELTLDALTDSGNLLRDPVSGRGVIFVADGGMDTLVDDPLCTVLREQRLEGMAALSPAEARRLCLIPSAETVQGRGTLIALRPDAAEIAGESVTVLLCPTAFAQGSDYDAIVPAALVPESRKLHIGKKE